MLLLNRLLPLCLLFVEFEISGFGFLGKFLILFLQKSVKLLCNEIFSLRTFNLSHVILTPKIIVEGFLPLQSIYFLIKDFVLWSSLVISPRISLSPGS